jgi:GNAT superfamily N-acetyltransferase
MQWIIRRDNKRPEALRGAFSYFLKDSIPHGEVTTTDDLNACAIWLPPGVWSEKPSIPLYINMLLQAVKWSGLNRIRRFVEVDNGEYARKPDTPHYYLAILGVHPDHQGEGRGGMLIKHTLEWVDELQMAAYLENSNKVNQPLYERFGFKTVNSFRLRNGGPMEWCMWRDPVNHQQQKA